MMLVDPFSFCQRTKYKKEMRMPLFNLTHIYTLILDRAMQWMTWHPWDAHADWLIMMIMIIVGERCVCVYACVLCARTSKCRLTNISDLRIVLPYTYWTTKWSVWDKGVKRGNWSFPSTDRYKSTHYAYRISSFYYNTTFIHS
jgi:hypothetical protein